MLECLGNPQLGLARAICCDAAAIVVNHEAVSLEGDCDHQALKILAQMPQTMTSGIYRCDVQRAETVEDAHVLAVCFCPPEDGWLFWFRDEQKGQKLCWSDAEVAAAAALRADLLEACLMRATTANRVQQSLICRLGHDLSNPLQSITMSAALLRPQSTRDTELSQLIMAGGKKMERLISQIRDLNRLQAGNQISINPVQTDISVLLKSVLKEEQALYPELLIQSQIEPGIKAMVDPGRYTEVIAHLLGNGHRSQGQNRIPTIVRLERGDHSSQLTISNQLEPLSAEQLAGLFRPVASDSLMHAKSGLGMGLYICAAIVQAHDGSVSAEQANGSITFTLTLPQLEQ
ncbi:sensor histidine kinase [Halopseudomonas sp.]|uniref:sensor histidine kinase n=1 Tax=Halopseudomonas sp. TaxID=2901191 RepID=UPI003564D359